MRRDLDCAHAHAGTRTRFLKRQVLKLGQPKRSALGFGQILHGVAQFRRRTNGIQRGIGVAFRCREARRQVKRGLSPGTAATGTDAIKRPPFGNGD